jgi:hypothetical protein
VNEEKPGARLMAKMAELLRMKREEVPEAVSKKLPEMIMPRKAVEMKREQLRKIDEQMKE